MNNNVSNISFSSRINIMHYDDLFDTVSNICAKNRASVKSFSESKFAHNIQGYKKGYTSGIIYCIAGLLKTTKDNFMFHLYPSDALKEFGNIVEFSDKIPFDEHLRGVLIGGIDFIDNYILKSRKDSLELLSRLKQLFKKFKKIDMSIFYGQPKQNKSVLSCSCDIMYTPATDTYDIGICPPSYRNKITPDFVKEYFKFIHISDSDEVFINNKKVLNSFFNSKKPKRWKVFLKNLGV
jgi:hypothetical protein